MRILYVAKHGSGGNDDEGSIAHALTKLGHEVQCIRENLFDMYCTSPADFMLCHHWHDLVSLSAIKIPKVVWCFDLIDWPEPAARHEQRRRWARDITSMCDLAFFTDGDWVAADRTGKAHWLTQGADEREVAQLTTKPYILDILFVGSLGYGRENFVAEMSQHYGAGFEHVAKGLYGARLELAIRSAKIVVAPPTPVTDNYWSNRIYNMLRYGAFLVHPYSEGVHNQFPSGIIPLYKDMEDLHHWIEHYLWAGSQRIMRAKFASRFVLDHHTYRHRCEQLICVVKEKLNV